MRRRQVNTEGSLDLLLDTMCNAFGGIVLIAILVALLIDSPGDENDSTSGNIENAKLLVERQKEWKEIRPRLEQIEADLKKTGEMVELLRERNQLAAALSNKSQSESQAIENLLTEIGEVEKKKAQFESAAIRLSREISSLKETIETGKRQEEEIENQKKDLINSRKEILQMPTPGSNAGKPFNIIYRHGMVYPVQSFSRDRQGGITESKFNKDAIQLSNEKAEPIPGKGIDPKKDRQKIIGILNGLKRLNSLNKNSPEQQIFLSQLVYNDSFEAFIEVDKMIKGTGELESGWEPYLEGETVNFGTGGRKLNTIK